MNSPTRTIGRNRATYQSMNDDDSTMDASRLSKKSSPTNNNNNNSGGGSGKKKHRFFRKSSSGVRRSSREANTSDAGSTTSSSTFGDSFASFNVSTSQLVGFSCPFAAAAAHQNQQSVAPSRPPLPVGTNKLQRVCVVQNCQQHSARSVQQQQQAREERSLGPIDVDSLHCEEEQPADIRRRADYKGPVDLDTLETTTPYSRSFRHLETVQSGEMLFGDERTTVSTVSTDESQPVDVDDFLDASSWAQDEQEVVLDETDICRGLAGYAAGFEPEVIANLSQDQQQGHWDEDVDDEDDDEEQNKLVAQLRSRLPPSAHHKHTRSSASAPIPVGRQTTLRPPQADAILGLCSDPREAQTVFATEICRGSLTFISYS